MASARKKKQTSYLRTLKRILHVFYSLEKRWRIDFTKIFFEAVLQIKRPHGEIFLRI